MVHSFRFTVAQARRHGDLYFAALPDELTLCGVRVRVVQKGFRTRSLVV
jgi:hypothetical protein